MKAKQHDTIVLLGHVDTGKTTVFNILLDIHNGTKIVDHKEKPKLPPYQSMIPKSRRDGRDRGITIDNDINQIETPNCHFTIIDAPGHRDYIKNTISGIALADCAVLMISSQAEEFEAGISKEGQTRDHALLAYTHGIKHLIVAINKMDHPTVNYSEDRYNEIVEEVQSYLKRCGYNNDGKIQYVPISSHTGDNMTDASTKMKWYIGPTFLEILDSLPHFTSYKKQLDKPLRMCINDVYRISGYGTVVTGKIISGVLRSGTRIKLSSISYPIDWISIEMHHQELEYARAGDIVGVNITGIDIKKVRRGCILSDHDNNPAFDVSEFIAQIIVLNHPNGIRVGYTPVIDCRTAHVSCRIVEIISKFDRLTGALKENHPNIIKNGEAMTARLVPNKPLCVEAYKYYTDLGRFSVRDMNRVVAVGVIKEITKKVEAGKK